MTKGLVRAVVATFSAHACDASTPQANRIQPLFCRGVGVAPLLVLCSTHRTRCGRSLGSSLQGCAWRTAPSPRQHPVPPAPRRPPGRPRHMARRGLCCCGCRHTRKRDGLGRRCVFLHAAFPQHVPMQPLFPALLEQPPGGTHTFRNAGTSAGQRPRRLWCAPSPHQ